MNPPAPDPGAAERQEVQDALSSLARLRVLGQIEERDYLALRTELKGRERALTPTPLEAPALPAMLEMAGRVRASTAPELAELLDLLGAQFQLGADGLELVSYRPLSD